MFKKIKKKHFILVLIALNFACKNKLDSEQSFISNNFLKIVDTTAYNTGAFVLLPSDTVRYPKLSINLNPSVTYNKKIDEFTLAYFENNKNLKSAFKDLLENGKYDEFSLNSDFPKQIGKYNIFFNGKNIDEKIKYAGRIEIQNFKIYKNKAILILSKSVGHYGSTFIILLKREKDTWEISRREVLFQA
ncbi:MAG TPA: hypothetical protein DCM02_04380 [Flavobacterium sp.]|nr:hypothetical protein [Flavobacterium sp.]